MIYPKQRVWNKKILTWYTEFLLRKHFEEVHVLGHLSEKNKAFLVLGNHTSWWDGFWMWHLNQQKLHKTFHVMMLEKELKKRMFFNSCGAYSINPGNPSIRESLRTTTDLLLETTNMVLFYPEGAINASSVFPKKFQKGIGTLLTRLPNSSQIIFTVCLTDYFSHKKPSLYIYFKEINCAELTSSEQLETLYNQYYQTCLLTQNARLL